MSSNVQIGRLFSLIADLLELQQANPFRVRAYRRAAQTIGALPEDVSIAATEERLQEIPGIGKDLAEKIREFLENGTIAEYEALRDEVPEVLLQMTRIPGLGPKNALKIHSALAVQSLDDLEKAAKSGTVAALE
jgi:DNA polymerase (family 10)